MTPGASHNEPMDDIVKQAMAKWPSVPHAYGWLGLDARGNWWLRDAEAQALGGFASGVPGAKGALVKLGRLIDFIQRNYEADAAGRWFFQNGPQRVFIELEATPWVWRVAAGDAITAHDGRPARLQAVFSDEHGRVYLRTERGFGIVHTQDMLQVADAVEAGRWTPQAVQAAELPAREGYVPSPQAQAGGR